MKERVICYIMIYGCYGLFCSLEFLRFFKSVLFKFAEKSDGERVKVGGNRFKAFLLSLSLRTAPAVRVVARPDPLPYRVGEKGSGDYRQHFVSFRNFKHASNETITVKGLVSGVVDDA